MELKIQCQCGVKYKLDVTPETVANPVRFVCQYCNVDSSALVNEIIRQQFASVASISPPPPRPAAPAPVVSPAPPATAAPPAPAPQIRISVPAQAPSAPAVAAMAAAPSVPAPQIRINVPTPAPPPSGSATPPSPAKTPSLAPPTVPAVTPPVPAPQPSFPQPPQPSATAPAPKIKVQLHSHAPATPAAAASDEETSHPCHKHPGQFATEQCVICKKPICPKCMELFGYVCSAYCEGQAERQKIEIPFYAGKKTVVEGKYWKKVKLASAALALLMLGLFGAYGWYYFVGMRPRLAYSLKFPGGDEKGFCKLISKDEVILRHGNKLARHDLKNDKEVWAVTLIDKEQVAKVAEENAARQKALRALWKAQRAKLKASGRLDPDEDFPMKEEKDESDGDEFQDGSKWAERELVSQTRLYLHGQSIWAVSPTKATQYNVQSGKVEKEVPVPSRLDRTLAGDSSILLVSAKDKGGEVLTRIELAAGDVKTEEAGGRAESAASLKGQTLATKGQSSNLVVSAKGTAKPGLLPTAVKGKQPVVMRAGVAATNTLARPVAARRTAPRMEDMMESEPDDFPAAIPGVEPELREIPRTGTFMVFADENVAQMEIKLLQKNFVKYKAMKDKPKVSEFDKGVNAANAVAAMNELVNEMEADRTGGMRTEDESRYQVTIKRLLASGVAEWTGEVVGPAALFSSKTVDVLTAGKMMYVFDKANKKLWESKLAYPIDEGMFGDSEWFDDPKGKRTPFVERGKMLYFFDQGVLTAFDIASGNVKWRLTSVGISSVQFDDKGMLYVSTSSAGAESLKYTQQIDLEKRVEAVIMKVDPESGKIVWKIQRTGSDIYFSGKYMYTVEDVPAGGMRIYRLKPSNGGPVWDHYLPQSTSNRDFQGNTIQLLYDNELQVLRFL